MALALGFLPSSAAVFFVVVQKSDVDEDAQLILKGDRRPWLALKPTKEEAIHRFLQEVVAAPGYGGVVPAVTGRVGFQAIVSNLVCYKFVLTWAGLGVVQLGGWRLELQDWRRNPVSLVYHIGNARYGGDLPLKLTHESQDLWSGGVVELPPENELMAMYEREVVEADRQAAANRLIAALNVASGDDIPPIPPM